MRISHLRVPSLETCRSTISGRARVKRSASVARISLAMLVIPSKSVAPRQWSQRQQLGGAHLRLGGAHAGSDQRLAELGAVHPREGGLCKGGGGNK